MTSEKHSEGDLNDRYVAAVVSRAGGGTMGREDVEELAADVFTVFWNSAQDFSADRDVKPWLARTARDTPRSIGVKPDPEDAPKYGPNLWAEPQPAKRPKLCAELIKIFPDGCYKNYRALRKFCV